MPTRTDERTAAFIPAAGAPTLITATLKPVCKTGCVWPLSQVCHCSMNTRDVALPTTRCQECVARCRESTTSEGKLRDRVSGDHQEEHLWEPTCSVITHLLDLGVRQLDGKLLVDVEVALEAPRRK